MVFPSDLGNCTTKKIKMQQLFNIFVKIGRRIRSMEYRYLDFYSKFSCIADACEDTCCAGWQIMIDESSLKKYRNVKTSMKNRIHNCINWKEGCFDQYDKRCAFLNEENLCDLYAELGPDYLCKTCKHYPRHMEEFENIREFSLSLSCPEVCRLLFSRKEEFAFHSIQKGKEEEWEDFDLLFFDKLEAQREGLFTILQDKELSLSKRLALMLAFSYDVQRKIQHNQIFEIDEIIDRYEKKEYRDCLLQKGKNKEINTFVCKLFDFYQELEPLKDTWFPLLEEAKGWFLAQTRKNLISLKKEFEKQHGDLLSPTLEQSLCVLLFTYFLGAVYDYDVLTKIKFICSSFCLLYCLDFYTWQKEKTFSLETQVKLVHWYSKEVEHSDYNRERLEKILKTRADFHCKELWSILNDELFL